MKNEKDTPQRSVFFARVPRGRRDMKTIYISKDSVQYLPDAVLTLIAMGLYSLYEVNHPNPEIKYILRTGPKTLYGLASDGKPIAETNLSEAEILARVKLTSCAFPAIPI